MLFIKEDFAVFKKIHLADADGDHGIPAWLTAPPVAPQVYIRPSQIDSCFGRCGDCLGLAVVFGMTPFAKLVALSGRNVLLYSFALMSFVIVASVGAHRDDFVVFYNNTCRRHNAIKRMFA